MTGIATTAPLDYINYMNPASYAQGGSSGMNPMIMKLLIQKLMQQRGLNDGPGTTPTTGGPSAMNIGGGMNSPMMNGPIGQY